MTKLANFQRGFFRIWLVASAVWVLYMLVGLPIMWQVDYYGKYRDAIGRGEENNADFWRHAYDSYSFKYVYFDSVYGLLLIIGAVLPPIAVYVVLRVLVGIIAWVCMGFATSTPLPRERVGLRWVAGIIGKVFVSLWGVIQVVAIFVVNLLKELGEGILAVAALGGTGYLLWPLIGHWIEQWEAFREIAQSYERFVSSPRGRLLIDTEWKVTSWKIIGMIGILSGFYVLMCEVAREGWAGQIPWRTGKTQCEHCQQCCKDEAAAARCCLSEPPTPRWIRRNKLLDKQGAFKRSAVFACAFAFLWTGLAVLFEIAVSNWVWFWTTAGLSCAVGYEVYSKEYLLQVQCSECSFRAHNTDAFRGAERERRISFLAGVKTARPRLTGVYLFLDEPLCSRCFARTVQTYEEEELRRDLVEDEESSSLDGQE